LLNFSAVVSCVLPAQDAKRTEAGPRIQDEVLAAELDHDRAVINLTEPQDDFVE